MTPPAYYPLTLHCDASMGKVVGSGVHQSGKKVSISAKAKTGYVFEGWYSIGDDGRVIPYAFASGDNRNSSQSVIVSAATQLLVDWDSYMPISETETGTYAAKIVAYFPNSKFAGKAYCRAYATTAFRQGYANATV